jgi:hypothetical protein
VWKGFAIVLGLTVGAFLAGLALATGPAQTLVVTLSMGIGAVQALWVVPVWRYYRAAGETETVKGILIMASVVFLFLLNPGCWGLIATVGIP